MRVTKSIYFKKIWWEVLSYNYIFWRIISIKKETDDVGQKGIISKVEAWVGDRDGIPSAEIAAGFGRLWRRQTFPCSREDAEHTRADADKWVVSFIGKRRTSLLFCFVFLSFFYVFCCISTQIRREKFKLFTMICWFPNF